MGIDDSMKTWRMEKLSRFIIGVLVVNVVVFLIPLIDYVRGGGLNRQIVFVAVLSCMAFLFLGIARIRRRARAILSRKTVAVRGRFSWKFEVFQLADLDVIESVDVDLVSMEPLAVTFRVEKRTGTDLRTVPLPPPWMPPPQASEFRTAFLERWRLCREPPAGLTAHESAALPR